MDRPVYLDNAATTRIGPEAFDAMRQVYLGDAFVNPASQHAAGMEALRSLEGARAQVARCLRALPREVTFTSGGTEANNQALLTAAAVGARLGRRHIVASAIEHPSVLRMLERLQSPEGPFGGGFEVTLVRPDATGTVSVAAVKQALRPDTCLVSLMYANNEVGAIQPVRDVCRMCRKRGVIFHTDAVQAAGHLAIDFTRDGFDLMSVSAHKFHGPRGTGALLCSHRLAALSLTAGGAQERGHRAGTTDVAGACGMAVALELACRDLPRHQDAAEALRERLCEGLRSIPCAHVLGPADPQGRLAGIASVAFAGHNREALLVLLDERGFAVSAGSACAAGAAQPSHVLAAMGTDPDLARGSIRISIDALENSARDIDGLLAALREVCQAKEKTL